MSIVKIRNAPAVQTEPVSYLTADIASGVSSITVKNITGFAVNQILIIGELGQEGSEIVKTHASSAPSGSTVTLSAATSLAHQTGDKVYLVLYDQVEFSTATTATGSKSVLVTTSLWADSPTTEYNDTAGSTGYYFARFKNSITSTFSSYSDAMAVTGWTSGTVGYMVDRALSDLGERLSEKITAQDCYEWINQGIKLIQGKLKRWPEHYSYNTIIGQASRGTNVITMPTDAYDTETNKSIIAVRVGTKRNLNYLDPAMFDAQMDKVASTTTSSSTAIGATSIPLTNSYDFDDSGSVNVYISGTQYTITYTGVTRDTSSGGTGALTGVPASGTGSVTAIIPSGTYVWQNESEGVPAWFTVRNGNLEFWPLVDANEDNTNVYADYAKVATSVDSDGDVIDFQRADMLQYYLTWRMKMKSQNNGTLDINDGYYNQFKEAMNDAIRTLGNPNTFRIRPNINRMMKRGGFLRKANIQDLPFSSE